MSSRLGTKKRRLLVEALLQRDGDLCTWCCREMIPEPIHPFRDCSLHMTVEHLVPLAHNGSNVLRNLALACFECNQARGASMKEFLPLYGPDPVDCEE